MMAPGHVTSGLWTGLVTSISVEHLGPQTQAAWVAVWTGAVLLPDWDSPGTKVARMWGPISGGLRVRFWRKGKRRRIVPGITDIIGTLCGGHRRGSHSVVGLLLLLALIWVATWFSIGTGVVMALTTGLVLAAAGVIIPGKDPGDIWPVNLAISVMVGVGVVQQGWTVPGWVPWAMFGGAAVHVLGDMITRDGCPLGWPTSKHRVSLTPLYANGFVCCMVLTPLFGVLAAFQLAMMAGYDPYGSIWAALRAI